MSLLLGSPSWTALDASGFLEKLMEVDDLNKLTVSKLKVSEILKFFLIIRRRNLPKFLIIKLV